MDPLHHISWHAPEYIHTEKTVDWYWIVGIITISIAIIAIILNDVIFAVLIIISIATLSLYATRPPHMVEIDITSTGVHNGSTYHPYDELESYWVETRHAFPKVIFKSKKKLMFFISILLEDADPEEVNHILSQHLPKVEHTEPLLEKLLIYLGF